MGELSRLVESGRRRRRKVEPVEDLEQLRDEQQNQIVRGYRAYNVQVDKANGDIYLTGLYGAEWRQAELQARCHDNPERCEYHLRGRRYPGGHGRGYGPNCSCGIYAVTSKQSHQLHGSMGVRDRVQAIAATIGWGAVVVATEGWRAQFVRIEHLWIPKHRDKLFIVRYKREGTTEWTWSMPPPSLSSKYVAGPPEQFIAELAEQYGVPVELGRP